MILVDTSVRVDHLRATDPELVDLLARGGALGHPWITGEVALGSLAARTAVLGLLGGLPQATVADHAEVLALIEAETLHGAEIGYVDAQLLAATRLTPDATLWTRDKRLLTVATSLKLATAGRTENDTAALRIRPARGRQWRRG